MSSHRVAVVVDRAFGARLLPLAQRLHVWVCDTSTNREATEKAVADLPPNAVWNEVGVTTFGRGEIDSPEDLIIRYAGDIDLHHGEHSHDPAWSQIEVYGVRLNDALRTAWQEYGVNEFRETPEGFVCSRPPRE